MNSQTHASADFEYARFEIGPGGVELDAEPSQFG